MMESSTIEKRASKKALDLQFKNQSMRTYDKDFHIDITEEEFLFLHETKQLDRLDSGMYKYREFIVWIMVT